MLKPDLYPGTEAGERHLETLIHHTQLIVLQCNAVQEKMWQQQIMCDSWSEVSRCKRIVGCTIRKTKTVLMTTIYWYYWMTDKRNDEGLLQKPEVKFRERVLSIVSSFQMRCCRTCRRVMGLLVKSPVAQLSFVFTKYSIYIMYGRSYRKLTCSQKSILMVRETWWLVYGALIRSWIRPEEPWGLWSIMFDGK